MQPKAFVAKWRNPPGFGEKQASQEMFLDICALVEHPTPVAHGDPDAFTFEKRVPNGAARRLFGKQFRLGIQGL